MPVILLTGIFYWGNDIDSKNKVIHKSEAVSIALYANSSPLME